MKVGLTWGVDGEGRVMCPPGLESGAREPSPNTANLASLKKWAGIDFGSTHILSALQDPTVFSPCVPI